MEVAAGAVAYEVASTTVQGGALAGIAIAKKTMPLKATYTRIAASPLSSDPDSLCRQHHSVSVVNGKAYIFGGVTKGGLAKNDMHIVTLPAKGAESETQYQCVPALPDVDQEDVPPPRSLHSATIHGNEILIYGGRDADNHSLKESSQLWKFNTESLKWSSVTYADNLEDSEYAPFGHGAALLDEKLVLYGGQRSLPTSKDGGYHLAMLKVLDLKAPSKHVAPFAMNTTSCFPANLVAVDETLYTLNGGNKLSTRIESIDVKAVFAHNIASPGSDSGYKEIPIPSNPLTPGPKGPRDGAALVPISTGYGRHYLIYMFGITPSEAVRNATEDASEEKQSHLCSDAWTLQVPSTKVSLSGAKDSARDALGMDSGSWSWSEVELKTNEVTAHDGKVHPGPRAFAAFASIDATSVLMWGGVDPTDEFMGDGWIIKFE